MRFEHSNKEAFGISTDLLAIGVAKGALADHKLLHRMDKALDGFILRMAEEEQFVGDPDSTILVHTHGQLRATRILVVGLGGNSSVSGLRAFAGRVVKIANKISAHTIALVIPDISDDPRLEKNCTQHLVEGAILGDYRFEEYKTVKTPERLEEILLLDGAHAHSSDVVEAECPLTRGSMVANGIIRARNLINRPSSKVTPETLAREANRVAQRHGMDCEVLRPDRLKELGLNLFLAVTQGSEEPPLLIQMSYRPKGSARTPVLALVGKGVTYDASLLDDGPNWAMVESRSQMAGAATVIEAMGIIAQLAPPVTVHAYIPACETSSTPSSFRPGDVFQSYLKKTVEVTNTSAKSRMLMADTLAYAAHVHPVDELIDIATLTRSCVKALGENMAGVMSNQHDFAKRFLNAAANAGESMWELPLNEELTKDLKGDIGDLRNMIYHNGDTIAAALFLREFVGKVPWLHVDMWGPSLSWKETPTCPQGATGFGVATIVEYITHTYIATMGGIAR